MNIIKTTKRLELLFLFIVLIFSNSFSSISFAKLSIKEFNVKDIKDSIYTITLEKDIAVVFFNSINCHDCFLELNEYFKNHRNNLSKIYCIIRSNSNSKYSERVILNYAKKLFKADYYYFDIHNVDDDGIYDIKDGLFHDYNVVKTPAMIYVGDTLKFLSYDILFGDNVHLEKVLNKLIKR